MLSRSGRARHDADRHLQTGFEAHAPVERDGAAVAAHDVQKRQFAALHFALNELQHYVTSYLGHLLGGTEDRYWAPFIVKCLLHNVDPAISEGTRWVWHSSGGKGIAA